MELLTEDCLKGHSIMWGGGVLLRGGAPEGWGKGAKKSGVKFSPLVAASSTATLENDDSLSALCCARRCCSCTCKREGRKNEGRGEATTPGAFFHAMHLDNNSAVPFVFPPELGFSILRGC